MYTLCIYIYTYVYASNNVLRYAMLFRLYHDQSYDILDPSSAATTSITAGCTPNTDDTTNTVILVLILSY